MLRISAVEPLVRQGGQHLRRVGRRPPPSICPAAKSLKAYFPIPGGISPFPCQPAPLDSINTLIQINGRAYMSGQSVNDISGMVPVSVAGLHDQVLFALSDRLPVRSIEKIYPAGQLIFSGNG